MKRMQNYKDIDAYTTQFPKEVQVNLQKIRQTIQRAVPEAKEKISYGIPTFTYHGNLVHFAAYKDHYGFYPGAAGVADFKDHLTQYETSKGTIRFPIDQPIPLNLITDITKHCAQLRLKKGK